MADKIDPYRPVDEEALALAILLLRGSRTGALGVLDPETGFPHVSRIVLGLDVDGSPVMLGSTLARHTMALLDDPRCSLLVGENGKGDPMAHPRMTVQMRARKVERDASEHTLIRERFVKRNPKSGLYVDFLDFSFFKFEMTEIFVNGGFGKAYKMTGDQILICSSLNNYIINKELHLYDELYRLSPNIENVLAARFFREKSGDWRFANLDASGFELACGEKFHRYDFPVAFQDAKALIAKYAEILMEIR